MGPDVDRRARHLHRRDLRTLAGDAVAYGQKGARLTIETPDAARTDHGIGYGWIFDDLRAAYGPDPAADPDWD